MSDSTQPEEPTPAQRPGADDPLAAFQAHVRAARTEIGSQVAHARAEFDQANERIKERTGRDLLLAIVIGVVLGAIVIASLVLLPWTFVIFGIAVAALGTFELSRALQGAGRRIDLIPQVVLAAGLVASGYFLDVGVTWSLLFVSIAILVVWRLVTQMIAQDGRRYGDVLADVLATAFIPMYVPFLTAMAMVLLAQPQGNTWVLAFIVVAVAADTGAYAAGLSWGKHPMAPRISPKKTWEGFAGAVVASLGAGVLLALYLLGVPWWAGLILGAGILLTATVGDLGESMLKREIGIKDMSSWLPGHGGVLDRLDSILPSAAGALALYMLLSPLGAS